MYTLDANIFLRDLDPSSPDYDECHRLIEAIRTHRTPLVLPWLILAEVAGVVSRTRNDSIRGRVAIDIVRDLPQTTFVPLDEMLAHSAAEIAADHRLRGADAVYVAVARQAGTTLVTLDEEQGTRASTVVPTRTPTEALVELGAE
jgi:predicted nucleic acid-binding protein